MWVLFAGTAVGVDCEVAALTEVCTKTNDQDRHSVEENARGVLSPAYEPAPYSERDEGGVIQFVDWYSTSIESRLPLMDARMLRGVA